MARITLSQIQDELALNGWKVCSTEYTNLSTEMEFECPEGHKVFTTWEKLRKKPTCPICKQNIFKENRVSSTKRKKGVSRVLALDQSSHKTGYAVFDGKQLIKYGVFEATEENEILRFKTIRDWALSMLENWQPDEVSIEGIQYQQNMGVTTFQTLARLQGILMITFQDFGVPFKICATNTWRAHCGVKGRQRADKKRSMQLLVKQWYDISVSDDEADAIGIGKYAADHLTSKAELINWE